MQEQYYVVRYSGPFGFIKPWTAVRDIEVYSQQFLTPSITEGIRIKLEVSTILRHRLSYTGMDLQQEQTQSRGYEEKKIGKKPLRKVLFTRKQAVISRGVLLDPVLYLAFQTMEDADKAAREHICLCRNEDVLLPDSAVRIMTFKDFDSLDGFELLFDDSPGSVLVGYDRFNEAAEMRGRLHIVGNPTQRENGA